MKPDQKLKRVQTQLPEVLFVPATLSEPRAAVTLTGGETAFVALCQRVTAPVVFVEHFPLSPHHFLAPPEGPGIPTLDPADLSDSVELRPFQGCLGEDVLIVLSVPYGGVLAELELEPDWWAAFEDARAQAVDRHQQQVAAEEATRQQERAAALERELQLLHALLPEDAVFRRLACEARPRVTALREQAEVVLQSVLPGAAIQGRHDGTVREVAAQIKEEVRAARKR